MKSFSPDHFQRQKWLQVAGREGPGKARAPQGCPKRSSPVTAPRGPSRTHALKLKNDQLTLSPGQLLSACVRWAPSSGHNTALSPLCAALLENGTSSSPLCWGEAGSAEPCVPSWELVSPFPRLTFPHKYLKHQQVHFFFFILRNICLQARGSSVFGKLCEAGTGPALAEGRVERAEVTTPRPRDASSCWKAPTRHMGKEAAVPKSPRSLALRLFIHWMEGFVNTQSKKQRPPRWPAQLCEATPPWPKRKSGTTSSALVMATLPPNSSSYIRSFLRPHLTCLR